MSYFPRISNINSGFCWTLASGLCSKFLFCALSFKCNLEVEILHELLYVSGNWEGRPARKRKSRENCSRKDILSTKITPSRDKRRWRKNRSEFRSSLGLVPLRQVSLLEVRFGRDKVHACPNRKYIPGSRDWTERPFYRFVCPFSGLWFWWIVLAAACWGKGPCGAFIWLPLFESFLLTRLMQLIRYLFPSGMSEWVAILCTDNRWGCGNHSYRHKPPGGCHFGRGDTKQILGGPLWWWLPKCSAVIWGAMALFNCSLSIAPPTLQTCSAHSSSRDIFWDILRSSVGDGCQTVLSSHHFHPLGGTCWSSEVMATEELSLAMRGWPQP